MNKTVWQHDVEVDAQGLACPMPLLKAKLALNSMPIGAVLKSAGHLMSGSQRDFRSFARLAGHSLLAETVEQAVFTYWLRKDC